MKSKLEAVAENHCLCLSGFDCHNMIIKLAYNYGFHLQKSRKIWKVYIKLGTTLPELDSTN